MQFSLSSARWLLPWIAVLLVALTLAYATDSGLHQGFLASDQLDYRAALSTGETAVATNLELSRTPWSDTAMKPSGGRFGVMSTTSPASTGHASPNGCCTW